MDHVPRLYREPHIPDALTAPEVNVNRAAIAQWESATDHTSGPKPDGQLGAIVEVMLGTSARIGDVLAIRRRDIDITSPVPSIRLAGTIVSRNGEQTFRKDHPKTAKSSRVVALATCLKGRRSRESILPAPRKPALRSRDAARSSNLVLVVRPCCTSQAV